MTFYIVPDFALVSGKTIATAPAPAPTSSSSSSQATSTHQHHQLQHQYQKKQNVLRKQYSTKRQQRLIHSSRFFFSSFTCQNPNISNSNNSNTKIGSNVSSLKKGGPKQPCNSSENRLKYPRKVPSNRHNQHCNSNTRSKKPFKCRLAQRFLHKFSCASFSSKS